MVKSVSAARWGALQKWGSLLIAISFGVGAVVGYFIGTPFNEVMQLALFGVVAAYVARRYWRPA